MNHHDRKLLLRNLSDWLRGRGRVHFLHIGKTGGTAVKAALPAAVTPRYRLLLHTHDATLGDVPPGDKLFFFVRDPLSRFVSGFYSRQRQGHPRYLSPWSEGERVAFSRFTTPNGLADALDSSDSRSARQAQHAMRSIQHVRDSYWQWFGNPTHLQQRMDDVLFIGSQERLEADFNELCMYLGFAENTRLPTDPVQAHRNPPDLDRGLSTQAKANLAIWYRRDYELLNFVADRFPNLPKYGC
jgi:hypothetical protein